MIANMNKVFTKSIRKVKIIANLWLYSTNTGMIRIIIHLYFIIKSYEPFSQPKIAQQLFQYMIYSKRAVQW